MKKKHFGILILLFLWFGLLGRKTNDMAGSRKLGKKWRRVGWELWTT